MRILARGKINWALRSAGFLPGGYHELDMLMESVTLCDELTIEPGDGLFLTVDGERAGEENLVMRAALALRREAGSAPGARMALQKNIPSRAGLGGGSADCAAALTGLNRLWELGLSKARLAEIGLTLGADVPFCLAGGLCRAQGRGERLTRLRPDKPVHMLIAMGGSGLSTGAVFARLDAEAREWTGDMEKAQAALLRRDMAALDATAENALFAPASELDPAPGAILADMRALGAKFARMSGSGSACFGLFDGGEEWARNELRKKYGFCEICETAKTGWEIME